jgi:hypothetical protein
MRLHLVKLAVGVDDVAAFADWVALRVGEAKQRGERPVVRHVTRRMPRRAAELLAGGSLFWVVAGAIRVRQRLLGFEAVEVGGKSSCAIVLEGALIPTRAKKHRPFQGWRYLAAEDAPLDADGSGARAPIPPEMADALQELGLL